MQTSNPEDGQSNTENGPNSPFSFSLTVPKISEEDLSKKVFTLVQEILNKKFTGEKTRIVPYRGRMNFACPYCGDSHNDSFKKRGNIYTDSFGFKCFNCGKTARIQRFLSDFSAPSLDLSEEIYVNHIADNKAAVSHKTVDPYMIFEVEKLQSFAIERRTIEEKFHLRPVDRSKIATYLQKRLQEDPQRFSWNQDKQQLYIFNLIPGTNKVLGYQIRNFIEKPKYKTFKLSKIYEMLNFEQPSGIEEVDKISTCFGALSLDFSRPITIFEGPLDSFLFRNGVGTCSVKIDLPLDVENKRYFYDYDDAGREAAISKMEEGYPVFLWKKFLKDAHIELPTKKMDLTDLLVLARRKNIPLPKFSDYFSQSKYDIYDI